MQGRLARASMLLLAWPAPGCSSGTAASQDRGVEQVSAGTSIVGEREYDWKRLTEHAAFPEGYNFPVHVLADGSFVALRSHGTWTSRDGSEWTRSELPFNGLNSAYLAYVQHAGSAWSLGRLEGDYTRFQVDPLIERTRDFLAWEELGHSATLPQVVFYASASFRGSLWILGGHAREGSSASVWRSDDGLEWRRVVERAPWSARSGARAVVFGERLFLIGGGVVDGPIANDVWSSPDGVAWHRECAAIAPEAPVGFTPVAFDGQLWLVGANRSGTFVEGMLVSADGRSWQAVSAPWTPRGGAAVWTRGDELFLTGGKFSIERDGEPEFLYSNDVWRMSRR